MSSLSRQRRTIYLLMEIINGGDLRALDEVCSEQIVWRGTNDRLRHGIGGVRTVLSPLVTTFSDFTISVQDLLCESDRLACRFTWRGTFLGALVPASGTGQVVRVSGMALFRIENDQIVECWWQEDENSLIQQLFAPLREQTPGYEVTSEGRAA